MGCRRRSFLVLAFSIAAACERRPLEQTDAATAGEGAAGASGPLGGAGAPGGAGASGPAGAAGAPGGGGGSPVGGAFGGGDGICAPGVGGRGGSPGAACTDGIDNDGDGKIDYDDPECVGGHDNDESTFAWGIPGDNTDACRTDCFFDSNSGSGDDNCDWRFKCDPLSTALSCPYDAAYVAAHPEDCSLSSSQKQVCVDRCQKLVPNGCDCFGCCAIPGLPGSVRLAYTCTAADFGDPRKCPPCTQVTQCLNPCERCELCIGKPVLPDDCATPDGGAPYACTGGAIACGTHGIAPGCCPAATSCVTGCCLRLDPLP